MTNTDKWLTTPEIALVMGAWSSDFSAYCTVWGRRGLARHEPTGWKIDPAILDDPRIWKIIPHRPGPGREGWERRLKIVLTH